MKYYIDLGTYDGKLLKKSISIFSDFDIYIGFEPVPKLYKKTLKRFRDNPSVFIINSAVSTFDGKNIKFYMDHETRDLGRGSTLLEDKKIKNKSTKKRIIYVNTINFSQYIIDNFKKDDYIILKIDIEGKEYDILEHMIKTGAIEYIDNLYCEWHYKKMKSYRKNKNKCKEIHHGIVSQLNKLGFSLTGKNINDEFSRLGRRVV